MNVRCLAATGAATLGDNSDFPNWLDSNFFCDNQSSGDRCLAWLPVNYRLHAFYYAWYAAPYKANILSTYNNDPNRYADNPDCGIGKNVDFPREKSNNSSSVVQATNSFECIGYPVRMALKHGPDYQHWGHPRLNDCREAKVNLSSQKTPRTT
ncbi:unnamed protein product [Protopolystoma xenopodis]|uniref:Uncharacterized protein n=1 Tax=Protopolystoma xenopodis TaxID=117903 RepID=A0A3S5AYH8_9PLAT|nr:unnamed protein product [Protopolystoma xenopodis]